MWVTKASKQVRFQQEALDKVRWHPHSAQHLERYRSLEVQIDATVGGGYADTAHERLHLVRAQSAADKTLLLHRFLPPVKLRCRISMGSCYQAAGAVSMLITAHRITGYGRKAYACDQNLDRLIICRFSPLVDYAFRLF